MSDHRTGRTPANDAEMIRSMLQRIEALEAELRVLKADDAKAELSKQYHIAEDARRTASDKMNIAAQQDERLRYHGKFQAAIFKLTGTDTHAAALRVIEGWRPK